MKVYKILAVTAILMVLPALLIAGGYSYSKSGHKGAADSKDIVDTAISAGNFNTLVAALKAADLVETLRGEGPFTVFAPTDAAFAKLPEGTLNDLLKPENKAKLQAILTYHVLPGRYMAQDVMSMSSAKTVNGQNFQIRRQNGSVMVDNAQVLKADISADNGVIHVIDAVILPD